MTENISISKESEKFQTIEMKKEQIVRMVKKQTLQNYKTKTHVIRYYS